MEIDAPKDYFRQRDVRETERSLRRWRRFGILAAAALALGLVWFVIG